MNNKEKMRICVIGGGVTGLSTAIALKSTGYNVSIHTAKRARNTTSAVAAAFWYPFHVHGYRKEWAITTHSHFCGLASMPETGITMVEGIEYFDNPSASFSAYDKWVNTFWWHHLPKVNLQNSFASSQEFDFTPDPEIQKVKFSGNVTFQVPVIQMPTYLQWLEKRFEKYLGGTIIDNAWCNSAMEMFGDYDIVINCAGVYADHLLPKNKQLRDDLHPVNGHAVRVTLNDPTIIEQMKLTFLCVGRFRNWPLYIIPRPGDNPDILLGGSLEKNEPVSKHQNLPAPNRQICEMIIHRCKVLEPLLDDIDSYEPLVGMRPVRTPVRVEADSCTRDIFSRHGLFHNYGHGGGGVTLSWGCAYRICELVTDYCEQQKL